MARVNTRRITENPKVKIDNFSGGMEYNNHSRDKRNNRVKFIKNLEITDDGKLELRKPMIPYLDFNGDVATPLFTEDKEIIKTFFYPSLNNSIKFIWLTRTKDDVLRLETKTLQGRIIDSIIPSYIKLNNILDYTYLSYADALYIKFKNGIIKVRVTDFNGIEISTIDEYNPTTEELTNVGINLFNKDPFTLKDALTNNTASKISGLIWAKKNGNLFEPIYNIKRTDTLFLKARLEVSIPQLENEVKAFDADRTLEVMTPSEANDPSNINKVQIAMPRWVWYKHKVTIPIDVENKDKNNYFHSVFMPMFLTDIDNVLSKITDTTLKNRVVELRQKMFKNGWDKLYTTNKLYVGQSNPDDEEYILKIHYENGYNTSQTILKGDELNSKIKHFRVKTHTQTKQRPSTDKYGWYDKAPTTADMKKVIDVEEDTILSLSNYDARYPTAAHSQQGVSNAVDVFELELINPTEIITSVAFQMADWGPRSFDVSKIAGSDTGKIIDRLGHKMNWAPHSKFTETITAKKGISISEKDIERTHHGYKYKEAIANDYDSISVTLITPDDIDLMVCRNNKFLDAGGNNHILEIDTYHKFSGIRSGSDINYFWQSSHSNDTDDAITPRNLNLVLGNINDSKYPNNTRYQDGMWYQRPPSEPEDWAEFRVDKITPGDTSYTSWLASSIDEWRLTLLGGNLDKKYIPVECKIPEIINESSGVRVSPKSYKFFIPNTVNNYSVGALPFTPLAGLDNSTGIDGWVQFSTNVYTGLIVSIIQNSKPNDEIARGAIIKYSSATETPIKFNWDLKNSEYLFSYWEKLGVYGYTPKPGVNLPYNLITLTTESSDNYFPNTNILDVYSNDNHLVTQVLPWKNNLLAFTESSTTMFIGRDASRKEVISTIYGLSQFNRNTAKVVSNSVVMKSGHDVIAFVPAPGTDNASSLNIRPISQQISPYIEQLDNQNPIKVYAHTYKHEYWLVYVFDKKTIILKYTWDKYAWIIHEYPVELYSMFSLDADTTLTADIHGHLYDLTNIDVEKDTSIILRSLHQEDPLTYLTGDTNTDLPGLSRDIILDASTHRVMVDSGSANPTDFLTLSKDPKALTASYVYAYDGDTVTVLIGNEEHKIRVLGIDAPEIRKYTSTIDYGKVAKQITNDVLSSATSIKVIFTGAWTYKREVGRILYQDTNGIWNDLAYTLLDAGAVRVDYISTNNHDKWYYPNNTYVNALITHENTASTAKKGIWGAPNDVIIYEHELIGDYTGIATRWGVNFYDINYELNIGDRKPSDDTMSIMADSTLLIGNNTQHNIVDQKLDIYIDNSLYRSTDFIIPANTNAIAKDSSVIPWLISESTDANKFITKITKSLYKNTETFNINIHGSTANNIYIDGIVATYTQTDRKNFR